MPLINWEPAYSVGIREIDKQHMKLIDLVNELHEGMKSGKGKEILGNILNELVKYTSFHFSHEEQLFDKYDYPDTAVHKRQHKELVEQVMEYKTSYESGKSVLSLDIMTFLKDWLIKHIAGSDKNYTAYLNSKGVY
jgi:hemerythrin